MPVVAGAHPPQYPAALIERANPADLRR